MHVGTPIDKCRELNNHLQLLDPAQGYPSGLFENLVFRYEEPNGMSRWDSPLFTIPFDDASPPIEAIWEAMVGSDGKAKVVKQHHATMAAPPTDADALQYVESTTAAIIASVTAYQQDHPGESGGTLKVPKAQQAIQLPTATVSLPQLQRLRRQYLALMRTHRMEKERVADGFVNFMNRSWE